MIPVMAWLRRLDANASLGRAATRLVIIVPLCLLGALLAGGAGFVAGVYFGLLPVFDGYTSFMFPYYGAVISALVGGGLALTPALRNTR